MQDDQQPAPISTPEQTVQPASPSVTPSPAVTSMPPTQEKSKKGLMSALMILLVLLAAGAAAYFMMKSNKDKGTANQSSSTSSATEQESSLLEKIKTDGLILSPDESEPSQASYVDNFYFKASATASINIAPAEVYLDYKIDSATLLPKLRTLLTDNGLSEEPATAGASPVTSVYSNDKVSCNIGGNIYWTRMWCVRASVLKEAKDNVAAVLSAVAKKQGSETSPTSYDISFSKSSDSMVKGAVQNDGKSNKNYYFVYKDNVWTYVSMSNVTQSSTDSANISVDCVTLSAAQYKDVFIDYTANTQNCPE